jgi:hypothetical protein
MRRFKRWVRRQTTPDLAALLTRAYFGPRGNARYRVIDRIEDELAARREEAELAPERGYDATDACYMYDRHNPLSPWAY